MMKRTLTEHEAKLHADHRCICCGVKVKMLGKRKDGEPLYHLECLDCLHLREPKEEGYYSTRGKGGAGIGREFTRRMGTNLAGTSSGAEDDDV